MKIQGLSKQKLRFSQAVKTLWIKGFIRIGYFNFPVSKIARPESNTHYFFTLKND